jgi:hypothetical protein
MCGVDMSGNKAKRSTQICTVKPLKDDLAFKIVNGKEIWHPRWEGKIDDEVNAQFIRAVINHIQQNEEVSLLLLDNSISVLTSDVANSRWQQRQGGDQRH